MKAPKWLRSEKSSVLRKLLVASPDERLKEAIRQILFSRGESTVLSEKDTAEQEESAALKLCSEQIKLLDELRFRRCKLITGNNYEKSGTIVTIRPVYDLEKNYAHIRTDDGDVYIRSIDSLDLMILDEIDEKRAAAYGKQGDYILQDEIQKSTFRQSKALREAHGGLEKVGMLVQLKDSVGMDVLGRVSGLGIAKNGAFFLIYYTSASDGRRRLRKAVAKFIKDHEFFADEETAKRNEDAIARWQEVFEKYEGSDCDF